MQELLTRDELLAALGRAGIRPAHVVEDINGWRRELDEAHENLADAKSTVSLVEAALSCPMGEAVKAARATHGQLRLYRSAISRMRPATLRTAGTGSREHLRSALSTLDKGLDNLIKGGVS